MPGVGGGEVPRRRLGDLLVVGDGGYVRGLRIGAVPGEGGIVIALGAIFGGLGLAAVLSGTDLMRWLEFDVAVWAVAVVGGLGFGFLTLAGGGMLSWADPGRVVDSGGTARKVGRGG
ncbi:MAG TPA: hypothetical protein PKE29_18720, partial [Phycisphaerales bacterium]|nr:hypothetical protein [Phycisphaerales bacterium]